MAETKRFNLDDKERNRVYNFQINNIQNEELKKEAKKDTTENKFGSVDALNEYCEKLYDIMAQEENLFTGQTLEEQNDWRIKEITALNDKYVGSGKLTSYDIAVANDLVREKYRENNPKQDLETYNSMTLANHAYCFIVKGKDNALMQYQGAGKVLESDKVLAQAVANCINNDVTPSKEQLGLVYKTYKDIIDEGYQTELSRDQKKQKRYKKADNKVVEKLKDLGDLIGKHSKKVIGILSLLVAGSVALNVIQAVSPNKIEYSQSVQTDEENVSNLKKDLEKIKKENESLEEESATVKKENEELKEESAIVKKENEEKDKVIGDLEETIKENGDKLNDKDNQIAEDKKIIEKLNKDKEEQSKTIDKLNEDNADKDKIIEQYKQAEKEKQDDNTAGQSTDTGEDIAVTGEETDSTTNGKTNIADDGFGHNGSDAPIFMPITDSKGNVYGTMVATSIESGSEASTEDSEETPTEVLDFDSEEKEQGQENGISPFKY